MKFSFKVPAAKDMLWTDEAAASIIGKKTTFKVAEDIVHPTEIVAAWVEDKGRLLAIEVEVKIGGTKDTS